MPDLRSSPGYQVLGQAKPRTEAAETLRAADCKTPADWARWAAERREYEDPYGYSRERY